MSCAIGTNTRERMSSHTFNSAPCVQIVVLARGWIVFGHEVEWGGLVVTYSL